MSDYYLSELEVDSFGQRDQLIRSIGRPISAVFGVDGEAKVVCVIDSVVLIPSHTEITARMKCTPVLNLLCPLPSSRDQLPSKLYWINLHVACDKVDMKVFQSALKEGAEKLMSEGTLDVKKIHIYKAVAESRVHIFVPAHNHKTAEDVIGNIPAMNQLGPNAFVVTKTLFISYH